MRQEMRARYLLRAAQRAERLGDKRAAKNLRRMVEETRTAPSFIPGISRE